MKSIDLIQFMPPVTHQGKTSSCSGHAMAALCYAKLKRNCMKADPLSANFIYFIGRKWDSTQNADLGSYLQGCAEAVRAYGACLEDVWPNDPERIMEDPFVDAWADAYSRRIFSPARIEMGLDIFKRFLDAQYPIACVAYIFEGFRYPGNNRQNFVPMPKPDHAPEELHSIVITGYDDDQECFRIRNSWGESWGEKGYAWIPYEYLTFRNFGSNFWIVK